MCTVKRIDTKFIRLYIPLGSVLDLLYLRHAINNRTIDSIITASEAKICGSPGNPFCVLARPIFSIRRNACCLSSLFVKDQAAIDKLCRFSQVDLPTKVSASYVLDGIWLLATEDVLPMTLVCIDEDHNRRATNIQLSLPRGNNIVRLQKNCKAVSEKMKLPLYFANSSSAQSKSLFQTEYRRMGRIQLYDRSRDYETPRLDDIQIN